MVNVMTLWTLFWESGAMHAKSGDEERNQHLWPMAVEHLGVRKQVYSMVAGGERRGGLAGMSALSLLLPS